MTIREEVKLRIERDTQLERIRKKIERGKASYTDTATYSIRAGKLTGEMLAQHLPEVPLDEREQLCVDLLHDRYIDINAAVDSAQKVMDEAKGLHLAPQRAPFNSERAQKIGSSIRDVSKDVETQKRRARAATETATKAMHDDRMEAEAKFRSGAGLKCYITRLSVGGCCKWCTKVAGRYEYGSEPEDIFRRHDNCDCTVTYENGRERQDVWSKKTWTVSEDAGAQEPVRFTQEQAAAAGAEPPKVFSEGEARQLNDVKVKENTAKPEERKELLSRDKVDIADNAKTTKPVEKASAVEAWEAENYKNSTEKGLLILPDGTTKDFGGIEHHVTGKEEDIKLMDGATFTHNHPTDNTFSQNDIVTGLVKGNLKEMRAVTSTGDVHILVNNGATEQQRRKFNVDYQQRRMKAANAADAKIRRGEKINKDEYVKSRLEDFMTEHAEEYNLSYTKSKIDTEEGIHSIKGKKNKFEPSVNMDCVSGSKPITEQLQKELSSEYDKFTEIFGKLDNVRVVTAVPYKKDGVWGAFNDNSNELFLFGIGGDNGKTVMINNAKKNGSKGLWSTESPYHAYRHELGHAWQKKAAKQDLLYDKKIEKISKIRDDINDNINKALTDNSESDIIKLRKGFLSDYGLDPDNDIDEFISECIAEYCDGSPRETSRSVINILFAKEL